MGRKEPAATGVYRAVPDSMWTCRASPPMTRIELHRAFRLASRALIFGPYFRLGHRRHTCIDRISQSDNAKTSFIPKSLIISILRINTNDITDRNAGYGSP